MESAIMLMLQAFIGTLPALTAALSAGSTTAAVGTTAITGIVAALEQWVPLIISIFPSATSLFQSVKNIIASLSTNPGTPAAQLAVLQQLDAQVDTAFEAIAVQEDPDAPTAKT